MTVVIVTAAAPIDNAHVYSSGRVARGGVDAVVCRTTGCGYPYVGTAETRVVSKVTFE